MKILSENQARFFESEVLAEFKSPWDASRGIGPEADAWAKKPKPFRLKAQRCMEILVDNLKFNCRYTLLCTEDIYYEAVTRSGYQLKCVPKPFRTSAMCLAAVKTHGDALEYIPSDLRTYDVCLAAVSQSGHALKYVPEELRTNDICMIAVMEQGIALNSVPAGARTHDICLAAVTQHGSALEFVPNEMRTHDICLAAVSRYGRALKHVPEPLRTHDICLAATKQDVHALEAVPDEVLLARDFWTTINWDALRISERFAQYSACMDASLKVLSALVSDDMALQESRGIGGVPSGQMMTKPVGIADENSIGHRIRALRTERGLKQKDLAIQLGIAPNYLGTIERGLRNASEIQLRKIAKYFDIPYSWLIGEGTSTFLGYFDTPERLTKRAENGAAILGDWAINKDPISIIARLCDRLADFEDKGIRVFHLNSEQPLVSDTFSPEKEAQKKYDELRKAVERANCKVSVTNNPENRAAYEKAVRELDDFAQSMGFLRYNLGSLFGDKE